MTGRTTAMMEKGGLAPGSRFGRYEVVRRLGAGGFGAVYEAVHCDLQKRVALETLHHGMAMNPAVRSRFVREGIAASRLRHPHVVDVSDVGVEGDVPFLVMELLDGEDLGAKFAREGALTVRSTLDVILPVCAAIAAAHEHGVVHRDLKPDNIFLARTMAGSIQPKVLDFGIVKLTDETGGRDSQLTGTSTMLGTAHYMSPEQVRESRDVDGRSDQYTLGVIVYECVAGTHAFDGDGLFDILQKIHAGTYAPLATLQPSLPIEFAHVVSRAMSTDASARFESVAAFARALLPFASRRAQAQWSGVFGEGISSTESVSVDRGPPVSRTVSTGTLAVATRVVTVPPPADGPASRSRRAMVATSVVAGLLALGVGVRMLWTRHDVPASEAREVAHAAVSPVTVLSPPVASSETSAHERAPAVNAVVPGAVNAVTDAGIVARPAVVQRPSLHSTPTRIVRGAPGTALRAVVEHSRSRSRVTWLAVRCS